MTTTESQAIAAVLAPAYPGLLAIVRSAGARAYTLTLDGRETTIKVLADGSQASILDYIPPCYRGLDPIVPLDQLRLVHLAEMAELAAPSLAPSAEALARQKAAEEMRARRMTAANALAFSEPVCPQAYAYARTADWTGCAGDAWQQAVILWTPEDKREPAVLQVRFDACSTKVLNATLTLKASNRVVGSYNA